MSQSQLVDDLLKDIVELESRLEEVEALEEQVDRLQQRVDDLDERTDMLQLVDDVDQLDGRQRSITLLQHMQRQIQRMDGEKASLTKPKAEEVLHYPDIDRTTYYSDMRRCERLVGDDDVCWYETAEESAIDEPQVVLNLGAGELPADLNGGA